MVKHTFLCTEKVSNKLKEIEERLRVKGYSIVFDGNGFNILNCGKYPISEGNFSMDALDAYSKLSDDYSEGDIVRITLDVLKLFEEDNFKYEKLQPLVGHTGYIRDILYENGSIVFNIVMNSNTIVSLNEGDFEKCKVVI